MQVCRLCECGCDRKTSLITRTRPEYGLVKGEYRRFIVGHQNKGQHNGRAIRPYESLFLLLLKKAKRRNLSIGFSYEEFLEFTKTPECRYCGVPINWEPFNKLDRYNLDRRNSSIGYTKENCVVCCKTCNCAKRTMSDVDFIAWIEKAYKHTQEKQSRSVAAGGNKL